ncbi:hypothetical protein VP01_3289g1 [Puccinia sorghi]|uniref:Uncharacterized protein n=1 Tax=Puccinia sorghi TaxID=27349 RepID=A0A0L6UZI3_9BASI|nr:hypothetical protein VP01_3289g1 [Puccinia sorghi]
MPGRVLPSPGLIVWNAQAAAGLALHTAVAFISTLRMARAAGPRGALMPVLSAEQDIQYVDVSIIVFPFFFFLKRVAEYWLVHLNRLQSVGMVTVWRLREPADPPPFCKSIQARHPCLLFFFLLFFRLRRGRQQHDEIRRKCGVTSSVSPAGPSAYYTTHPFGRWLPRHGIVIRHRHSLIRRVRTETSKLNSTFSRTMVRDTLPMPASMLVEHTNITLPRVLQHSQTILSHFPPPPRRQRRQPRHRRQRAVAADERIDMCGGEQVIGRSHSIQGDPARPLTSSTPARTCSYSTPPRSPFSRTASIPLSGTPTSIPPMYICTVFSPGGTIRLPPFIQHLIILLPSKPSLFYVTFLSALKVCIQYIKLYSNSTKQIYQNNCTVVLLFKGTISFN